MNFTEINETGLLIPELVFGTSSLGNLYEALSEKKKEEILNTIFNHMDGVVVLDSAGKYGAGLALESIGRSLKSLGISSDNVIISNKLGWYRVPLQTAEPTFEPGVWKGLSYDAVQKISYQGILQCWEQGCDLLGDYLPQMVSVHDPDEYLAAAENEADRKQRLNDIIDAYRALTDLRKDNKTSAVGIGAKDWHIIKEISAKVELDWVMFANSFTIYHHPAALLSFIDALSKKGITIINSAVFHSGFLTGGSYFDYKLVEADSEKNRDLFDWRNKFFELCKQFNILPAEACVRFTLSYPAIKAIALSTTKVERIRKNIALISAAIPSEFWQAMQRENLISGHKFL